MYIEFYGQKFMMAPDGNITRLPYTSNEYDYPDLESYTGADAAYILAEAFIDGEVIK